MEENCWKEENPKLQNKLDIFFLLLSKLKGYTFILHIKVNRLHWVVTAVVSFIIYHLSQNSPKQTLLLSMKPEKGSKKLAIFSFQRRYSLFCICLIGKHNKILYNIIKSKYIELKKSLNGDNFQKL